MMTVSPDELPTIIASALSVSSVDTIETSTVYTPSGQVVRVLPKTRERTVHVGYIVKDDEPPDFWRGPEPRGAIYSDVASLEARQEAVDDAKRWGLCIIPFVPPRGCGERGVPAGVELGEINTPGDDGCLLYLPPPRVQTVYIRGIVHAKSTFGCETLVSRAAIAEIGEKSLRVLNDWYRWAHVPKFGVIIETWRAPPVCENGPVRSIAASWGYVGEDRALTALTRRWNIGPAARRSRQNFRGPQFTP